MSKFVTTSSGKISFRKENYVAHYCRPIVPRNQFRDKAEIHIEIEGLYGGCIEYSTDKEMLSDAKEINDALQKGDEQ